MIYDWKLGTASSLYYSYCGIVSILLLVYYMIPLNLFPLKLFPSELTHLSSIKWWIWLGFFVCFFLLASVLSSLLSYSLLLACLTHVICSDSYCCSHRTKQRRAQGTQCVPGYFFFLSSHIFSGAGCWRAAPYWRHGCTPRIVDLIWESKNVFSEVSC